MTQGRTKQIYRRRRRKFRRLVKLFSNNPYNDDCGETFIASIRPAAAALAAVCPVGESRELRPEGIRSCALATLLAEEVGCSSLAVYGAPGAEQRSLTISDIRDETDEQAIQAVIELRLKDLGEGKLIELEEEPADLTDKNGFIIRAVRYSFEYRYRDSGRDIIARADGSGDDPVRAAAKEEGVYYASIGINIRYMDNPKGEEWRYLYEVLLDTLSMLSDIDWRADRINAYRLWQSGKHKPQDKAEIVHTAGSEKLFEENSLLNICTYGNELERVRLYKPIKNTVTEMEKQIGEDRSSGEYIFLTNRLIEILFGRPWVEGKEDQPGLMDAPVIVYTNRKEEYPVGLPKANQIDGVYFSSTLYDEKREEAKRYDYVIFNRYTDSRLWIDFEKADYGDFGRVRDSSGNPARKVLIPRYYKKLLGYLDVPVRMIRSEEFEEIVRSLAAEPAKQKAFHACYEQIKGEVFHNLKPEYASGEDGNESDSLTPEMKEYRETVIEVQNRLDMFNKVEILRIPKEVKPREGLFKRAGQHFRELQDALLQKAIGKSEYLLKTQWTSETDDRNNIARLSPNMMSLLGVTENDKILVRFGKKTRILRVLGNDELTDYQIGLPAPARKDLGMNSVNDIVVVHREMRHIFWRHSEEQTIAILGTILAVFQVIRRIWVGALLSLLFIPIIMYFVLNEERVKVK